MPKQTLVLEIEVPDFNAEGIAETLEMESEPDAPYTAFDYLTDIGSSPEIALGWTAPEADNERTIVALNGLIKGARISEVDDEH